MQVQPISLSELLLGQPRIAKLTLLVRGTPYTFELRTISDYDPDPRVCLSQAIISIDGHSLPSVQWLQDALEHFPSCIISRLLAAFSTLMDVHWRVANEMEYAHIVQVLDTPTSARAWTLFRGLGFQDIEDPLFSKLLRNPFVSAWTYANLLRDRKVDFDLVVNLVDQICTFINPKVAEKLRLLRSSKSDGALSQVDVARKPSKQRDEVIAAHAQAFLRQKQGESLDEVQ